jgi:glucose/arabinose dehydrogenase
LALVGSELLGAAGAQATCDHPPEAEFTCANPAGEARMEVNVSTATYARWSLRWGAAATPLTGAETLVMQAQRTGNLAPNLYLVEQGGRRIYVSLERYGLGDAMSELFVPLAEIKDEAGAAPDFGAVTEIQIVFEWADMTGTLALESLRFAPVWEQPLALPEEASALAAGLTLPPGFVVEPAAAELREMTQIQFAGDGSMLVSQQLGRVWRLRDDDHDGRYDRRSLYIAGFTEIVGLLYDPQDGAVWIGGRGQLYRTLDSNGDGAADVRELRIDGLPWGRHQNNGLAWNPAPDPFTGEPGGHWLYFGLGSVDDLVVGGPLNAAILRFPRTGQDASALEVVSQGNRNAYALVWAPVPVDLQSPEGDTQWQLFASENGPDFNDAPDEINHIRRQHHYGFPEQFGSVAAGETDGEPYSGPVYPVAAHASADGLVYVTNPDWPAEYRTLYVSLFGEVFSPVRVGHTVERVTLAQESTATGPTYRGTPSDFIVGLDRPLPLAIDPDGNLIVGDYATGVVYRVKYVGE